MAYHNKYIASHTFPVFANITNNRRIFIKKEQIDECLSKINNIFFIFIKQKYYYKYYTPYNQWITSCHHHKALCEYSTYRIINESN